jgi:type I restriction enzyme S subunit
LRPKQDYHRELVYLAATAPENIERLSHLADGAAYPAVRPDVVVATSVPSPDIPALKAFSAATGPLVDLMESKKQESVTMVRIRDLLLPKLMSGEIRIRDAECIVEDVA